MRKTFMQVGWGLATAALVIATPVRAVADTGGRGFANSAPAAESEVGGGWDELMCAACVGAAAYSLFTGGAVMLPVFLANPAAVGTLSGACLLSCRSAFQELMK